MDFLILVTLGTQDKQFVRLLKKIDELIESGYIKEKVIVQAGCTIYKSKNMEIFDLIDRDAFNDLINKCSLLITHGGVGSILTGLKNNKIVIASPRLAKYNEHINDHQIQIIDNFSDSKYILSYYEGDDLKKIIEKSKKFKPKEFKSNTSKVIDIITDFIEKSNNRD